MAYKIKSSKIHAGMARRRKELDAHYTLKHRLNQNAHRKFGKSYNDLTYSQQFIINNEYYKLGK